MFCKFCNFCKFGIYGFVIGVYLYEHLYEQLCETIYEHLTPRREIQRCHDGAHPASELAGCAIPRHEPLH